MGNRKIKLKTKNPDQAKALYDNFCEKMAKLGTMRYASEGPLDYANRAANNHQEQAQDIHKISLGGALEIVLMMTLLALAPAIVLTMTCFTRIVIVLSFLKRAMSMQDLPPAVVVTGFSLFMTVFIMKPVVSDIYENAYKPYVEEQEGVTFLTAADQASQRLSKFMLRQTRGSDLQLILDLSGTKRPNTPDETPFQVVVPAFILSEIKTAFQMGFVLFLVRHGNGQV